MNSGTFHFLINAFSISASHTLFVRSVGVAYKKQMKSLGYYKPLPYDVYNSPTWYNGLRYLYRSKKDGRWFFYKVAGSENLRYIKSDIGTYSPFDKKLKWVAFNSTKNGYDYDDGFTIETVPLEQGMLNLTLNILEQSFMICFFVDD